MGVVEIQRLPSISLRARATGSTHVEIYSSVKYFKGCYDINFSHSLHKELFFISNFMKKKIEYISGQNLDKLSQSLQIHSGLNQPMMYMPI